MASAAWALRSVCSILLLRRVADTPVSNRPNPKNRRELAVVCTLLRPGAGVANKSQVRPPNSNFCSVCKPARNRGRPVREVYGNNCSTPEEVMSNRWISSSLFTSVFHDLESISIVLTRSPIRNTPSAKPTKDSRLALMLFACGLR